ncbi:LysE family translocator [Gynuella sunshinyii]|uniref:Putative threonine efflux protein n=1 Tax=Gynuella sunshinyii YC6258 TaxID=1445510 RepID=A0A0C5VQ53_9GAMM|nr:LysE family translocator [Gynuella sunshinyii]AJQ96386.1 putative threonine efflux protein [Gynuella sunshinyii YC6258]
MEWSYLLSVMLFAFTVTITPGPNNLMLTASGVNFGFARTVPHLLGVTFGYTLLCIAVALGLGALFVRFPILHSALKVIGAVYLLYLAWKIAMSGRVVEGSRNEQPMTFWQGAVFQLVNPKGWTMAVTAISAFTVEGEALTASLIIVVVCLALVSLPCCSCWALLGTQIKQFLTSHRALKIFNYSLASLTAGSVLLII